MSWRIDCRIFTLSDVIVRTTCATLIVETSTKFEQANQSCAIFSILPKIRQSNNKFVKIAHMSSSRTYNKTNSIMPNGHDHNLLARGERHMANKKCSLIATNTWQPKIRFSEMLVIHHASDIIQFYMSFLLGARVSGAWLCFSSNHKRMTAQRVIESSICQRAVASLLFSPCVRLLRLPLNRRYSYVISETETERKSIYFSALCSAVCTR